MKVTITRNHALWMNERLSSMNFGHFEKRDLEKMVANDGAIRHIADDYRKMMAELQKRLYGDIDRKEIEAFNKVIREDADKARADYPVIAELFDKQKLVDKSLRMKVVEIELEPISRDAFIKAAILGKADIPQGAYAMFAPMFSADENGADDFAELDELMADNL